MSPFKKYFRSWAAKRAPRSHQVILRHKTIYVFPGRQGLGFLFVVLLIWVLGTNYQNNLILGFTFFLISVMLVSIIHAFKNVLGLTFTPAAIQYTAVGDIAAFDVTVSSHYKAAHHGLMFVVDDAEPVLLDIQPGHSAQIRLGVKARHRGWLMLPRITLKSYFPFGLIRAWAYIDLEHRALIFPRPIPCEKPPLGPGKGHEGMQMSLNSGDEFQGFRTYQPGSPLSQIAWKQYARGAGLHLKDYRALQSQHYWLDWQALNARDTESGLSHMSYWVNQFADKNIEFGLRIPGTVIDMGSGDVHRVNALTALALLGWERES